MLILVDLINKQKVKSDTFHPIAPNNGCIISAVKKEIGISKICGTCQLHILRCLYQNDVYTLDFRC